MKNLSAEQNQFQDILVGDFQDSYYNVTKKVLMGMNFIIEHAKEVEYVIHIDDDVYVSIPRFLEKIYGFTSSGDSDKLDCGTPIIKPYNVLRPDDKKHPEWGLSKTAYSKPQTPSYCNGPCYGMPIETYEKIYKGTKSINFKEIEKLDDLILTGILRAQYQIPIFEASGLFCWHLDNKKRNADLKMVGFHELGRGKWS